MPPIKPSELRAATDLLHLPFAAPPAAAVAGIVASVRAAHAARHEARRLLDLAKQAVEVAIEENETAALSLLRVESE